MEKRLSLILITCFIQSSSPRELVVLTILMFIRKYLSFVAFTICVYSLNEYLELLLDPFISSSHFLFKLIHLLINFLSNT